MESSISFSEVHAGLLPADRTGESTIHKFDEVLGAKPARQRILIIEDDVSLSNFLSRELVNMHFEVDVTYDAESALTLLLSSTYDLVVLDLNLPRMDGIGFLQQIRSLGQPRFPILVLTARPRTEDMILALDHGADDCLIKPFSFQELQARMRSLLRRNFLPLASTSTCGDLVVNREQHRVSRGKRAIQLTPREFSILDCLMSHAGKPVSRTTLMKEVWQITFDPTTNIVDVYMKYLRDKVDHEGEVKLIRTIRGVGYELRHD